MANFEGCEHFKHSPFLLQITAAGRGRQIYSRKEQVNQKSTPPHPAFYWRLGQQFFFCAGELKKDGGSLFEIQTVLFLGFMWIWTICGLPARREESPSHHMFTNL